LNTSENEGGKSALFSRIDALGFVDVGVESVEASKPILKVRVLRLSHEHAKLAKTFSLCAGLCNVCSLCSFFFEVE